VHWLSSEKGLAKRDRRYYEGDGLAAAHGRGFFAGVVRKKLGNASGDRYKEGQPGCRFPVEALTDS
jgi:hypothetical protein